MVAHGLQKQLLDFGGNLDHVTLTLSLRQEQIMLRLGRNTLRMGVNVLLGTCLTATILQHQWPWTRYVL